VGIIVGLRRSRADESGPDSIPEEVEDAEMTDTDAPQPGAPTLGGMQFWGDICYFQGFRIQQHVFTGHFRLLDKSNRRFQSGTIEDCRKTLDRIRAANNFKPDTGHAVIYLHGIGRTSRSMRPILNAMPTDGFVHVPFEYPSTRVPIEHAAGYLHSLIESLTDVSRISFVVHSMGGLIVRRYLKDHSDPRIHRMVMLGTPNSGAELADMLRRNVIFRTVYGPASQELVTDPKGTIGTLPTPTFEFGVIAGGKGDDRGFNPLLPGDDDGTVTLSSARLAGASDFLRIPKIHSLLMSDDTAIAATICFLEHGRFSMEHDPAPILRETTACR
ncbi:MAG: alpha/beta fold hydrolase, partial [Planctomycetaceae bacterium]